MKRLRHDAVVVACCMAVSVFLAVAILVLGPEITDGREDIRH